MVTFSITVADTQATRVYDVFGELLNEDGAAATQAQVETWLLRQVRDAVLRKGLGQAAATAEQSERVTLEAEGW